MKNKGKIIITAGTIATLAIVGNLTFPVGTPGSRIVWDHDDDPATIDYFYVRTWGPNGPVNSNSVRAKEIYLTNILGGQPFGVYTSHVVAVGMSKLHSDASSNLVFRWYGDQPKAVKAVRIN